MKMKKIKLSEIFEDHEGMLRWIDEDGDKQVWEPFQDWCYDDLDDIIDSFASNTARFLESKGHIIDWNK